MGEKDGEGKCLMPRHSKNHSKPLDGCFEKFGSNMANCTATNGRCLWVEKDGQGKCLMPRHSKNHGKPHEEGSDRGGKGGSNTREGGDRAGKGGQNDREKVAGRGREEGGSKAQQNGRNRNRQTGGSAKKAPVEELKKLTAVLSIS